jgi:phage terminase small subunit
MLPKQELFIYEYMIDYNGTRAYKKVYNIGDDRDETARVNASKLLSTPNIKAILEEKKAERTKNLGITAEFVLNGLKTNAIKCSAAEEIFDKNGNSTGKYKIDSSGSNKAFELLGKHLKLFTERIETVNTNINQEVSKMSDIEIEKELNDIEMNK